ncbi:ZYRO0F13288p [Zygosaccharomyces rouxii]|uniref:ZYRO0F13288p n=1 Tax=Zygosaccharomyces rouxii (strain ATCC 2623 / CBS 732 / NBRC 1130 / NCYC 568 / NRRL Y-229) TaxID=559307 RepID=C5DYI4_ZYGRC|nr:uncharacterized protein ZYRO0F13288g [Zygosaccharomyces rouxii]KAH9199602.1 hypothetical protein LQ764DRAFT_235335 [Zygosaccharomyces rouxii]CAR28845.1 ZYRO0F13288p [Zygosaccharomyces rouxii]
MGLIKKVTTWSYDELIDYVSVNPTRDEVTHYKVDPQNEADDSIMKMHTVKDFGSITCLDFSDFEVGLVAVGEKGGYVRLFNIMMADNPEYESIDMRARAKQQRCVNTLGVNSNGLVAMGLDRNRNDPSLQIWDINYQNTSSSIVNPTFSYCPNENIVSSKFLNETGIIVSSTKFLKEIDIRAPQPIYQHPTRLSYDIKLNPFNEYQFSTYGDDGTLAIWDKRKIAGSAASTELKVAEPLLVFEKLVGIGAASKKYMNSCFRWSTVRNREFATLHRGDMIKRWWLDSCGSKEEDGDDVEGLFVSRVRDINTTFDRVLTFDYIPQHNYQTSLLCMRQSGTVYRMPVTQSYTKTSFNNYNSLMLSNCEVPDMDEIRITSGNQKSNVENVNKSMRRLSFEDLDLENDYLPNTEESDEDRGSLEVTDDEENSYLGMNNYSILWKPENLLEKDISVIIKARAMLGYGLDPMATVQMIDGSKTLQNNTYIRNTWRWIAIAKAAVDDGTMVSGDLDLGYEGIIGIWDGLRGISNQNRLREGRILNDKHLEKEIEKIIKLRRKHKQGLGTKSGFSRFADSPKLTQRKLCLVISGWDLSASDFEEKYQNIIKTGNYEKAAAWAVFFGDIPKAVEILSSAKKEKLNLIATAVAGYMAYKDQPGNNSWRQQCRKMSAELEDPYLRVIFAFIADDDWWDILYEPAISLRERLGVALRFLNDIDLSRFLERTSSAVIKSGELEGLILTGITPSGIDLLQSYVDKTSDVQTAALISLFGCPRYFKDKRVDEWVQTYRSMLNSWGLFAMRSKFDCLRTKLSETSNGEIRAEVKPRQMYVQCMNCKENISKTNSSLYNNNKFTGGSNGSLHMTKKYGMTNTPSPLERQNRKHSCPHCGTPFPRCVICLLSLGTSNLPFVINGADQQPQDQVQEPDNEHDEDEGQIDRGNENYQGKKLRLNEWFSFCLSCNHGMHAGHAEEWFEKHNVCPAPGCSCQCSK